MTRWIIKILHGLLHAKGCWAVCHVYVKGRTDIAKVRLLYLDRSSLSCAYPKRLGVLQVRRQEWKGSIDRGLQLLSVLLVVACCSCWKSHHWVIKNTRREII